MASEGSREIEAAKQRLAAAKAQKSSASKMIRSAKEMKESAGKMAETAKTHEEVAQSQLQSSEKEVEAADAFLKEAEQRWEVIDLADDTPQKNKSRKKRKASAAAGATDAGSADTAHRPNITTRNSGARQASAAAAGAAANENSETISQTARIVPNNNAAAAGSSSDSNNISVRQIVVEGCGIPSVNGTYNHDPSRLAHCHSSQYWKEGWLNGKMGDFILYRQRLIESVTFWFIGFYGRTAKVCPETLYRTMNSSNTELPPESGWVTMGGGVSPAPKLIL